MKELLFLLIFAFSFSAVAATSALKTIPTMPAVGGSAVKLDPKAKGYVVVFVSAKCPCSNSHIAELKELASQFKEFQFFGVHSNIDETKEMTESYFKKADLPFPLVHDHKAALADELKAYKTPHAFVLSPDGEILYQGGVTNSSNAPKATEHFLKAALEDLKDGRKVKIANGRTLGCVISREGTPYVW